MNRKIELTREELEEIKDEIRFREKVILQLKQLNGLPRKVTILEVFSYVHWALIILLLGMAWNVMAK